MIQRRDTKFSLSVQEDTDSKMKSDYIMLERKYERLVEKERRLQVGKFTVGLGQWSGVTHSIIKLTINWH